MIIERHLAIHKFLSGEEFGDFDAGVLD